MTEAEIREIIDRETRAWDNQNLDMLMSIFHQDMICILLYLMGKGFKRNSKGN